MGRNRKRRRKNLKAWYPVMAAAAVLCIAFLSYEAVRLYRLKQMTEAQIAGRTYAETGSVLFQGETVEYAGKTYRRNTHVKAILCMGVDRKGTMEGTTVPTRSGQADGIFVIAQDTARNTLKILMVPRDTMTEITLTDLSGNVLGKDIQHLTLAYAYGDGREKSCELVAEAVSDLLGGLKIDHYMAGNIEIINILNDSVGGVTVTVPTSGMEKRDAAFVEGATITLHGEQAESFVRYRDIQETHSAIYRMSRQREYIMQFFGTVKRQSARNSAIVTDMLDLVEDYMVTDMGKEEYLKIALDALEMAELAPEDFYVVPGQAVMTEVYDEFHADREALTPIILELFYREAQ